MWAFFIWIITVVFYCICGIISYLIAKLIYDGVFPVIAEEISRKLDKWEKEEKEKKRLAEIARLTNLFEGKHDRP